ncbi:hypothetical protein WJX73_007005 [Symbiochloris irregularis]|uniref:F-box domain-containing protein n=1 Tax=Symbiochloris irregularis TaxID=706552 RepID=A0AAW1NUA4_9CHLO
MELEESTAPGNTNPDKAIRKVFSNTDLVERILKNLHKREAVRVARTCKGFQAAVQQLAKSQGFRPRLVVACSGDHKLVEVDITTGTITASIKAQNCAIKLDGLGRRRKINLPRNDGLAGIAFAPDHRLYVCHYMLHGVLAYPCNNGIDSDTKVVFSNREQLRSPKGICVARDRMYVASADAGAILCIKVNEVQSTEVVDRYDCGIQEVPWGLTASPDGKSLFVACSMAYQSSKYAGQPPKEAPGHVRCIPLRVDGSFETGWPFCSSSCEQNT